MMIQASIYTRTPPTRPPGTTDSATQITRTIVGSTAKYSAIPPQTPPSFESTAERINRLREVVGRCRAPQRLQKLEVSAISVLQREQIIFHLFKIFIILDDSTSGWGQDF